MSAQNILLILIAIIILDFALEQFLLYLNIRNQKKGMPPELAGIYDEGKYKQAYDYYREKSLFSIISSSFSLIVMLIVFGFGILGWFDNILHGYISNTIIETLIFFGAVFIVLDILGLPFRLYDIFVIEQKYGFNKMTLPLFFTDKLKGYLLGAVIGGGILAILIWLILTLGANFWIYFWVVFSAFILLINMFYTSWIVPLFNKLTPLPDGELKSAIEGYSKKVDFPLDNIFVIDGSKRSSKANAFFSGLGKKKKIVLFDTLIHQHTTDELVAVLAHEVGHYKKKHIIIGFILSVVQAGILLFILSYFVSNIALSQALGGGVTSLALNLVAFSILFTPISTILGIIFNVISRRNEYEADNYAATTYNGEPLAHALKKLSTNNLSNLTPHPWYVFVHYSHPPVLDRLKALIK